LPDQRLGGSTDQRLGTQAGDRIDDRVPAAAAVVVTFPPLVLAAAAGYLLGSIPSGLLITRLAGKGDIRRIGSGNIGATNVLRSGSTGLAATTLVADGSKGALAVLLSQGWGPDCAVVAGLASVLGHDFPIWLGFRGGKGIATTLGVLLALAWPVGLIACAVWLAVAALFRYSSVAGLVALLASPVLMAWLDDERRAIAAALLAALACLRHHANLRRLWRGDEPKIGGKA
jgi:glycerol-3-phosphate acyltransferase PlsY